MIKLYVKKRGNTLVPAWDSDAEALASLSGDVIYHVTLRDSHSPEQHRLLFAIARTVLANAPHDNSVWGRWGRLYETNPNDTPYNFLKALEIELGYFDVTTTLRGELHLVPLSLSYDAMGKKKFEKFLDQILTCCEEITGLRRNEILDNLEEL